MSKKRLIKEANLAKMDKNWITNEPQHNCNFCKKGFVHKSSLCRHIIKAHNKEKRLILAKMDKKWITKDKKAWKCDYCEKVYKYQSGCCKHKNKCGVYIQLIKEEERMKQLVLMKELEHKNEMIELLKSNKTTTTTNNTNCNNTNNTVNNKININLYLNETCKNALNLTDFVKQITVSLEDILKTKSLGYSSGVSEILIKNWKDIPQTERPVQCMDVKPLEYYVKDGGNWSKNENEKMEKLIGNVTRKQTKQLKRWCRKNPKWKDSEEGIKKWRSLQKSIMGSSKAEEVDVENEIIIGNICKNNKIIKP